MALPEQFVTVLVVFCAVAVVVLGAGLAVLGLSLRQLRAAYRATIDPHRREDILEALVRHLQEVDRLRDDFGRLYHNHQELRELLARTVSRVGVVRYDAFDDMGGALSFSTALLDEHGDGVIVSGINGRTEGRTYAKPVLGGESEFHLSPEEITAIQSATSEGKGVLVDNGRRRRRRAASFTTRLR